MVQNLISLFSVYPYSEYCFGNFKNHKLILKLPRSWENVQAVEAQSNADPNCESKSISASLKRIVTHLTV